ncbi:hypothetical protein MAQ5080_01916 [Marinomonas aquimarina]|uniref:DUF2797 domain-containing protein n=1 Tax=Marinomonas aquimarina TaxID=295068 RepID=A0A1A8TGY8_9GAMM|nr:DUF2797 domain-containing protein [Marinomonas aquimarina]SBS31299.1 hypothetical protein MAQ5080_01916 [Marinomonas aquimarina]
MIQGNLRKMPAKVVDGKVHYELKLGDQLVPLADLIGEKVALNFTGQIHCIHCGRASKKSFSQGYCYPCFKKLAACDTCIMSPEKCHYFEGTCREPEWGDKYCMQSHYVYLSNTTALKVGITRGDQLPTRWIDQGATQARAMFLVENRRMSGLVESLFKSEVADKTNWRNMLKGLEVDINLEAEQERLINRLWEGLDALQNEYGLQAIQELGADNVSHEFVYPVLEYPSKIASINAEKTPLVEGTLMGIKGQYWILDTGVINLRKYTGYEAEFTR